MKHILIILVLGFSTDSVYSKTFKDVLGRCEIRNMVETEFKGSGQRFDDYSVDWATDAIASLDASSLASSTYETLESAFHKFISGFTEDHSGIITIKDLEKFRNSAKACGMFPCSSDCCSSCASPPCGKKTSPLDRDLTLPGSLRPDGKPYAGKLQNPMSSTEPTFVWQSTPLSQVRSSSGYRSQHCDQPVFTFEKLQSPTSYRR